MFNSSERVLLTVSCLLACAVAATGGCGKLDGNGKGKAKGSGNGSSGAPAGLSYAWTTLDYTVGTRVAANLPTASGGTVTTYSISPALPAGLSLDSSTGYITGIPTASSGAITYTVTATN